MNLLFIATERNPIFPSIVMEGLLTTIQKHLHCSIGFKISSIQCIMSNLPKKRLQIRNRPLTDTKGGQTRQARASRCSFSGNNILSTGIKTLKLTGNHSILCSRMAVMVPASWPLKMASSLPIPKSKSPPSCGFFIQF